MPLPSDPEDMLRFLRSSRALLGDPEALRSSQAAEHRGNAEQGQEASQAVDAAPVLRPRPAPTGPQSLLLAVWCAVQTRLHARLLQQHCCALSDTSMAWAYGPVQFPLPVVWCCPWGPCSTVRLPCGNGCLVGDILLAGGLPGCVHRTAACLKPLLSTCDTWRALTPHQLS